MFVEVVQTWRSVLCLECLPLPFVSRISMPSVCRPSIHPNNYLLIAALNLMAGSGLSKQIVKWLLMVTTTTTTLLNTRSKPKTYTTLSTLKPLLIHKSRPLLTIKANN